MPPVRITVREAVAAVAEIDPVMAKLIAEHDPPQLKNRRTGSSRFEQLAESICYQQLAGKAAEAIWKRTRALVDGPFSAEAVLEAGYDALRAAGSSGSKATSIMDLATKVAAGEVRLDRIGRLSDDEVIAELVPVRGIGRWTAQMFLIFTLQRLDVWPVGDYGVRVGYTRAYGLPDLPTEKEMVPLGDKFRPYRTIAAWYCWRVAGTKPPT
jgi:3-methyladenine DNA glycosylase/8-oxoguanine DNA glycosylase